MHSGRTPSQQATRTMAKTDSPEASSRRRDQQKEGEDYAEEPAKGLHLDDDAQLHERRGAVRGQ